MKSCGLGRFGRGLAVRHRWHRAGRSGCCRAALAAKIVGCCGTSAMCSRRSAGSSSRRSMPSMRDRAGLRIVEAQQHREHGALAGAGRADQGHGFAGRDLQVEIRRAPAGRGATDSGRSRRRSAMSPRTGRGNDRGCAGAAIAGVSSQQFGDPAHAAGGALQVVPDFGQRADRAAADQRVEHELGQRAARSCGRRSRRARRTTAPA